MISSTTLERLRSFRLGGIIDELIRQEENVTYRQLDFEDRLKLLVDAEYARRVDAQAQRLLKQARIPKAVSVDDVKFTAKRKLNKQAFLSLLQDDWLKSGTNVIITGATGLGKTFLSSVVTHHLCRRGIAVRYQRTHRWLADFLLADERRRFPQTVCGFRRVPLLVFDEWLRDPVTPPEARLLLDLFDDRYQQHSVMLLSQFQVSDWHSRFTDPTLADAILDRLVHNAVRFALVGPSMRDPATETQGTSLRSDSLDVDNF